jgi:hypothetical protein
MRIEDVHGPRTGIGRWDDAERDDFSARLFESSWKEPHSDRGVRRLLERRHKAASDNLPLLLRKPVVRFLGSAQPDKAGMRREAVWPLAPVPEERADCPDE